MHRSTNAPLDLVKLGETQEIVDANLQNSPHILKWNFPIVLAQTKRA